MRAETYEAAWRWDEIMRALTARAREEDDDAPAIRAQAVKDAELEEAEHADFHARSMIPMPAPNVCAECKARASNQPHIDEATQEWRATDDPDYDEAARQEQERP